MNFKEINGNLFDRELESNEYYVHCVSRDYACGVGIAKEFNKRYNLTRKLSQKKPSKCMLVDDVFNLVTKSKYWQKPTYDSLKESLLELHYHLEEMKNYGDIMGKYTTPKTLVMPKIGCGLDRLNWKNVKKIIKDIFNDMDINIEIYYL